MTEQGLRRPRAVLVVMAAVALLAGQQAATAMVEKRVKHVRTITFHYSAPCGVVLPVANFCYEPPAFTKSPRERYLSVRIQDATGQPVAFAFMDSEPAVDTSGDSKPPTIICGSARKIPIRPGGTFQMMPVLQVGSTSCPMPATSGTVTVKLSNLP